MTGGTGWGPPLRVVDRELSSVCRNPVLVVAAAVYGLLLLGSAWLGGAGSHVGVALDTLTLAELGVPVLAAAIGYRAVQRDRGSGELAVLATYPVTHRGYVLGVYVGRLLPLLAAAAAPVGVAAAVAAATGGATSDVLATHAGGDSALLTLRYLVLTAVYAAVALALVTAASAVATDARRAAALALAVVIAVAVGIDTAAVAAVVGGLVPPDAAGLLGVVAPNGAFRALVLETVAGAVGGDAPAAPPVAAVASLAAWLVAALAVACRER